MSGNTRKKKDAPKGATGGFTRYMLAGVLVLMLITSLYGMVTEGMTNPVVVPISEIAVNVKTGSTTAIVVTGSEVQATNKDGVTLSSRKEDGVSIADTLARYGVDSKMLSGIKLEVKEESVFSYLAGGILLQLVFPLLFIVVFFWFVNRQMRGSSMQVLSFGQTRARIIDPSDQKQKVTFADVAGVKEAKEELLEVVDFLKNPKKFLDIGARIPKGVLLVGPPGTGKTLLARAVAGEAGVPFIYLSGSEFVEMFVGVGASRTRDLFEMAKKVAPSIIFIDEIDAVGRHRGSGLGGGNDEREQTLNQILVEMDGFEQNEKVVVLSGTNRPDVLDPALLRPGRFDRRVVLDLPDLKDRQSIMEINVRTKPLEEDVDLKVIAERTPGFSGADLANLVNEASILAARENRKKVAQKDLIRSIEKVLLGPERKSHLFSEREKKITAYHEAGHALVSSVLPDADPVHKVTIISRGHAGGYTLKLPLEEKRLRTRREFLDDIAVSLGGYAAEQMTFGDVTTGPSNDIAVASDLARDMVTRYGMSDVVGPVSFDGDSPAMFFGQPIGVEMKYSEDVSARVDGEVAKIMHTGLERAKKVLSDHKIALDSIANELMRVESLERADFERLLVTNNISPKKKEEEVVKPA